MAELANRADRIFPKLAAFFGRTVPTPVIIDLGPDHRVSKSYADVNTIGFPKQVVDRNAAIIAHEMTHLFMPERHSEALREGIAVYAQDRFGEVNGFPNYGRDGDRLVVSRLAKQRDASVRSFAVAEAFFRRNRGTDGRTKVKWEDIDPDDRRNAYLLAGSFTRYLLETELAGDMTAFKRLYKNADFNGETGKSLAELEAAWRHRIGLPN
ncbi:hypothetical protein L2D14_17370 [Thalassospiraceae bacterium LMO-JJ14]|nr:hypothetical protein L2D14_17370 [Thalassospiraceae bacterium LMO-JJ14]